MAHQVMKLLQQKPNTAAPLKTVEFQIIAQLFDLIRNEKHYLHSTKKV